MSVSETAQRSKRILVVDDHPVVREGIETILRREPDFDVLAGAASIPAARERLREERPELALLDISLSGGSGIEFAKELISYDGAPAILMWSMHDEMLFATRALKAGARGYIEKSEPIPRVLEALRRVAEGKVYLSPKMTERVLSQAGSNASAKGSSIMILSDRELEVFELIGAGYTTRGIAAELELSPKTVETHRENIKGKLGLANASELVIHATRWVLADRTT
jgi:DNA-binding NarL/FixJ family response regulator